jgi:hypothetical protein
MHPYLAITSGLILTGDLGLRRTARPGAVASGRR